MTLLTSGLRDRPPHERLAVPDPPPDNPRAGRRRAFYLAGLLPLLLAVLFSVKVVAMRHHDDAGAQAWRAHDGATALEQYSANRSLNLLERWLAPFDQGDAAFLLGDHARARDLFTTALETVPEKQECTVRINLALADEAIGDTAADAGSLDDAKDAWQAGIDALDAGDCPQHAGLGEEQSKDAATVRQRLERKLQNPPQQSQQNPQQQPKDNGGEGSNGKEKRLEQRNRSGSQDRSKAQDLQDYTHFNGDYSW